jgi:flagellar biosynthesis protein
MAESEFKKVVGLQYEPGEGLPRVILKGSGRVAEEILRLRNSQHGVDIIKNEELVNQLYRLPMDAEITPDLYDVVALVLAHVFSVNEKAKEVKL